MTDATRSILGTGFAFPLHVGPDGSIAMACDRDDVEQAIGIILSTAPGERPMRPEFGCGVHDCVFERIDAQTFGRIDHEVRTALDRWEPRIEVEDVELEGADDPLVAEEGVVRIHVRFRVKATNDVRNLVHPFYVIPAEHGQ
jgi:uncharacterized protein